MTTTASRPDTGEVAATDPEPTRLRWRPQRWDLLALGVYLLGGVYLTAHLWLDPSNRMLASYPPDTMQFEYWLAHAAHVVTHGGNPFFTSLLNVPMGVNMMANTGTFALTIPLAPVTLLFGPQVSLLVMVTLCLPATAIAWYWLFSRHLVRSRLAALLGAGFCGFAPGMVSQANGHPNLAAQFLVPVIAWRVCQLRNREHLIRNGVILGLLVTLQMFINEELVLLLAFALAVFIAVWALGHREQARRALRTFALGLTVAAGTALVLLIYPLWYQFRGPQHYRGFHQFAFAYSADIAGFVAFPTQSLGGTTGNSTRLAQNLVEQNSFLGWPLAIFAVFLAIWLWRVPLARAMSITAVVMCVLSLGSKVRFNGVYVSVPGPWSLVDHLPILDSVITTRFALILPPTVGILIALAVDRLTVPAQPADEVATGRHSRAVEPAWPGPVRALLFAALVGVLVPLFPLPLPAINRPAVPAFISAGVWRQYVPAGRTLVTVPPPSGYTMAAMQWAANQRLDFAIPRGYFLGPSSATDPQAMFGAPDRPTNVLLEKVRDTGVVPTIGPADQAAAHDDLAYWRAAVLVLPLDSVHEQALLQTTTALLGQPTLVAGVWLWTIP